jgi:transcriptional regulator with XRE-family HTH domain
MSSPPGRGFDYRGVYLNTPSPNNGGGGSERGPEAVGRRLRTERERQKIGLRELARRVNVSASLISQVELGRATPSVATLYAIVTELGISLDELFFDPNAARPDPAGNGTAEPAVADDDASHPPAPGVERVVREGERKGIQLDSGVRWERLTPSSDEEVEFLYVRYDVGGASCPADSLMRHYGKEYGHVLHGKLGVTVGFDEHELGPGDSISFDSTVPHRLFNAGDQPAEGLWFVVGRRGDPRISRRSQPDE